MALKDLITDLSNFKYTDYGNAGSIQSQVQGRHGTPDAPIDNSDFDNGVGFGQDPNSTPQSFTVRGYTITGNKRFIVNYGGDVLDNEGSIYGMGEFLNLSAVGGGAPYYGNLLPITPRGSIYRDDSGNYQVPQEGGNTLPPGGISNIVGYTDDQVTFNIPQHTSTGPEQFTVEQFSDVSLVPNAHGSGFMNQLPYQSLIQNKDTLTHNVSMINLTGPTTEVYQTTLNTQPIAVGAHGSDFDTTPIQAYSSIFSNADGTFGLLSDIDSGFSVDDFYVDSSNRGPTDSGTFKTFTKGETSLKTISLDSPNVDPDGNEFYTFPDRLPYNLEARDNTIFGFDQPFMLKDIGDKWGPNVESTLDEGLVRGGIVTSVARGIADALRLSKFILTPKGILFAAKQAGFQLLNPREETRIWNPLSLGSGNTTALGIPLRLERHLGGGTYLDAIGGSDGEDSILTGYGNAVSGIQSLAGGKIAFQTARRFTLAHLAGLVPGAGGKVSLGALPEISFDLLAGGSGNITSLSPNTFTDSNDIGFDVPDRNIYGRNNKYHINTGPSNLETLPMLGQGTPLSPRGNSLIRRVTGADIGSPVDFTDTYPILSDIKAFTGVEDEPTIHGTGGLKGINRRDGGYSITLGSSDAQNTIQGIPAGNLYDEGEETFPYQQKHNKGSVIPIGLTVGGYGEGPKYGLASRATKESIFDAYDGEGKAFEIEGEFGNIPESQLAVKQVGIFDGEMFDDPNSPYDGTTNFIGAPNEPPKAFMIRSYQNSNSTFNPLISADERSTFQAGLASTIAYEPLSEEYPAQLSLRNRTGEFIGDKYSKDEPYADKPSIFIGDKSMLVMGDGRSISDSVVQLGNPTSTLLSNVVSVEKRNAFTHTLFTGKVSIDGKNSVLPYNDDLLYGNYASLDGGKYETNPERFQDGNQDETLIKQLGLKGSIGVERKLYFDGKKPEDSNIFTKSDADTNQFSSKNRYLGRVQIDGKSNYKSIFYKGDRLNGDPKVDFKTQYVDTDKFSRGGTAPTQGPFVKDGAKLQDFPRLNEQDSGGNYGNEGQALGFIKGGARKDEHSVDGLYGTNDGRAHFGEKTYKQTLDENQVVGQDGRQLPSGTKVFGTGLEGDSNIIDLPTDEKKITHQNNNGQEAPLGSTTVQAQFPNNDGSSRLLDRYRTLAYGELPNQKDKTNRYDEKEKLVERQNVEEGNTKSVPPLLSTFVTTDEPGIGTIRKGADNSFINPFTDNQNLIPYGQGGEDFYGDDYIKFKFYDKVNKKNIIFRATLSGLNESLSPEYSSERYIGRPDNVHVYQGVAREISFDFIVAPFSKQELLVCWEKINYLTGLTYPTWKKVGNSSRMEAPFIDLTIGDMYNKTPGYINSLSYSVEDNVSWDIDDGTQLPQVLNISVTFTHIGRHVLASQGKHYDLPWLRNLQTTDGEYKLEERTSLDTLLSTT